MGGRRIGQEHSRTHVLGLQEARGPDTFENKILALKGNSVRDEPHSRGLASPRCCPQQSTGGAKPGAGGAWLRLCWAPFRWAKPEGASCASPDAPPPAWL